MVHMSVGGPAEATNIVAGMPTDHPTSIPEARGRPGSHPRPRERKIYFSGKFAGGLSSEDQLQNPAHMVPHRIPWSYI